MQPFRLLLLIPIVLAAAFGAEVHAQAYPARPVRFIVPFAAGGAADLLARLVGRQLGESWGQQVIVDNRAGAGGIIGMQIAAKAPADGYTLLMGSSSTLAVNPALSPQRHYDPVADYTPISQVAVVPILMVAHPSVPVRSIAELIQLAKAKPGDLTYSSSGVGATPHITAELFRSAAGIQLLHVPTKGGSIAVNELLGGHVNLTFGAISTSLPHLQAGRMRALGVTTPRRSPVLPDVPAIAESVPGFEVIQWFGVFTPAGVPRALTEKIARDVGAVVASSAYRDVLLRQGIEPTGSTAPAAFAAYVRNEVALWPKRLKQAGIKSE
ncbi:MAG TPA: tripartite tricarboxylate transporter substrate binding protein [Burkholderiales bacterium]|nr:tripartite tricarboxylate transporter substrate binding protein [Burkholderiales bacterium]